MKLVITLLIFLGLSVNLNLTYAASGVGLDSTGSSLYKSGKKLIIKAKKLEKKNKIEKAEKLYLKALDKLKKAYDKDKKNAGSPDDFASKVLANPNDNDARFNLANALLARDQKEEATDHLLEIVKKDRKWKDDKARKKVLEILNANSEDDEFTSKVRQKLSNILFS